MNKTRYYSSFTDDFVKSAEQDFVLPENYRWVRTDPWSRFLSALAYALAVAFSAIYCGLFLHLRVRGRKNLRAVKGGFFLYGNHTQPVGDVFTPALCVLPRRIYTVVSPANYGIPVIGRVLPYLGALPITETLHGLRELQKAMEYRLQKGNPIVIYPEAHVWEYYTGIRPFPDTSFRFPAKLDKPTFVMTVTYKKSRLFKKPRMEVFLDGPFYGEGENIKEKTASLHDIVYRTMQKRSQSSDCEYIRYVKKTKA